MRGVSPDRELSRNPAQIRRRLRRSAGKYTKDIELYGEVQYGKPIEEWDVEELAHGRPRNKSGNFRGISPKWITPAIQRESRRRLLTHTFGRVAGHVDLAIQVIVDLIKCDEVDEKGKPLVDARTKLQACIWILENVLGKPKATVEITDAVDEKRSALAAAIVLDDGELQDERVILEGEIVEEEDYDDEEDDGDE